MKPIGTYSGRLVNPAQIREHDICIHDIAYHLSRINRYNGCTHGEPYNVADHSILASYLVDQDDAHLCMATLMHDSGEAYLGDMMSPLKESFTAYREIEAAVTTTVGVALGFTPSYRHDDVKRADYQMRRLEMEQLTVFPERCYPDVDMPEHVSQLSIEPMGWQQAYFSFITRFHELRVRMEAEKAQQPELQLDANS